MTRPARVAILAAALVMLAACDRTYDLTGGHIDCGRGITWQMNAAGFTADQRHDIWIAAGMVGAELGTAIRFDGFTDAIEAPTDHVLVTHQPTTTEDGHNAAATASPHADGTIYTGGTIMFNPTADSLPAGRALDGTAGSTYLKLALHEWLHYAGLMTVTGHPELMMNSGATAPKLGPGDVLGLDQNRCY